MRQIAEDFISEQIKRGLPSPPTDGARKVLINLLIGFVNSLNEYAPAPTPVTIFQLIKHRWKFSVLVNQANEDIKNLRFYSEKIEKDGDVFWIELELGKRGIAHQHPYVAFAWLNYKINGKDRFLHLPNLSKLQSIEGLQAFLFSLLPAGQLLLPRSEEQTYLEIKSQKNILSPYDTTIKTLFN